MSNKPRKKKKKPTKKCRPVQTSSAFDNYECSGQQILATVLEVNQYNRSDSFGVNPPLY